MAESIMLEKAKDFAVNIVNLCKHIKETKREAVLTTSSCVPVLPLVQTSTNPNTRTEQQTLLPKCRLL